VEQFAPAFFWDRYNLEGAAFYNQKHVSFVWLLQDFGSVPPQHLDHNSARNYAIVCH
jgi:hypothetical protein